MEKTAKDLDPIVESLKEYAIEKAYAPSQTITEKSRTKEKHSPRRLKPSQKK